MHWRRNVLEATCYIDDLSKKIPSTVSENVKHTFQAFTKLDSFKKFLTNCFGAASNC